MNDSAGASTAPRPRVVTIAFWLWASAAVVLLLPGLLSITVPTVNVRDQILAAGGTAEGADALVSLIRGFGVLTIVVGLAVGYMTGRIGRGHRKFRRACAVLSGVFAFMLLAATVFGVTAIPILGLLGAILLLVATVLAFRPAAMEWFAE